jgi:hypothetical protein
VRADVTERGPLPALFITFERIARRMALPTSTLSADLEKQHPPVAVFEAFIKGLLADTPATAVGYLRAALAGQPSFDRARLALWDVYADQGDHASALAAVAMVADDSPWFRRARFLAGLSQLNLKKYDEAFATFTALADVDSSPALQNNLGIVQLRRGGTPQGGSPPTSSTRPPRPTATTKISCSTSATRTGSIATRRRRPIGCARRSAQPRRRRRAFRARCLADRRQQQRRGGARA